MCNHDGHDDVLWVPGQTRKDISHAQRALWINLALASRNVGVFVLAWIASTLAIQFFALGMIADRIEVILQHGEHRLAADRAPPSCRRKPL